PLREKFLRRRGWTRGSSPRVTHVAEAPPAVIAGLDPAIHPLREKFLRRTMDLRVKPAGDAAPRRYDCGFHSRPRFCASASWSDDISPATVSRFLTAARLRASLVGKRAAARLNHICASTAFCVTPSPRA